LYLNLWKVSNSLQAQPTPALKTLLKQLKILLQHFIKRNTFATVFIIIFQKFSLLTTEASLRVLCLRDRLMIQKPIHPKTATLPERAYNGIHVFTRGQMLPKNVSKTPSYSQRSSSVSPLCFFCFFCFFFFAMRQYPSKGQSTL